MQWPIHPALYSLIRADPVRQLLIRAPRHSPTSPKSAENRPHRRLAASRFGSTVSVSAIAQGNLTVLTILSVGRVGSCCCRLQVAHFESANTPLHNLKMRLFCESIL